MKRIPIRDLGIKKFTGRWVPHELSATEKAKRVVDGRKLLEALRNDESQNFSHIMTGDESWFYSNYESPTLLARARDEVVPRVPPTNGSNKVMGGIFFTANRLLELASLPWG
jgi:hypothetical protein